MTEDGLVGRTIGHYRVLERVGAGSMGVVYRAHDERLDRDVALKALPPGSLGDDEARRRFREEALVLSRLNHPNIATIHDFDFDAGIDFLVMEFIPGKGLDQVIAEGGISEEEIRGLGTQLADGLVALHEHGIVHRDLKPANLRLTPDGRLKLLDFGLARLLQPATSGPTMMSAGNEFAGTLPYMSPEQIRGEAVDARADVYAAGAILYELATGRPLFPSARAAELVGAILTQTPAKPQSINPHLSDSLEGTILRALAKDRSARLPSAADLRGALGQAERTAPDTRARRVVRSAAFAAALLVVAAAAVLMLRLFSRDAPPPGRIAIAVLPFRAVAVSQPIQFLGVGIPDAIISRLATVQQLTLRPTMTILKYENQSVDPQKAGRALVTDYIVTGILQESGQRLGLSVQLVRVADGAPVWGNRYDVARSDLLTLQDQIAQSVAEALKVQMTAAERERLFRRYTQNAAAYERYLQGRAEFHEYSAKSVRTSVDTFEEALKLDSSYAPARAGVALSSAIMRLRFAPAAEQATWVERAEREARAALRIDPQLAEAHEALAAVYRAVDFDWEKTLDESQLALALNPSLDQPHLYRAVAFYHLGLLDQVELELKAASAGMSPANQTADNLVESRRTQAVTALFGGRYQESVPLFEDVKRLSKSTTYDYLLGLAYYYSGDAARAEATLAALPNTTASDLRGQAVRASLLAAQHATDDARALVKRVLASGYMDHHVAYSLGAAYAQLGDLPEARSWLERAAMTGLPCYPWHARDPLLNPLRGDLAFGRFLNGLESSWRALSARYAAAAR